MNSESRNNKSHITTTLLIVFIVLKLTNNINWSWWWVLSPFLIPLSIAIVLGGLAVIFSKDDIFRR